MVGKKSFKMKKILFFLLAVLSPASSHDCCIDESTTSNIPQNTTVPPTFPPLRRTHRMTESEKQEYIKALQALEKRQNELNGLFSDTPIGLFHYFGDGLADLGYATTYSAINVGDTKSVFASITPFVMDHAFGHQKVVFERLFMRLSNLLEHIAGHDWPTDPKSRQVILNIICSFIYDKIF